MRNISILKVRRTDFEESGYHLQRDGWLNSFTEENSQAMRENGVPWRGAREKRPEFFSILISTLTDKNDIVMDWQAGTGLYFTIWN